MLVEVEPEADIDGDTFLPASCGQSLSGPQSVEERTWGGRADSVEGDPFRHFRVADLPWCTMLGLSYRQRDEHSA